MLFQVTFGLTLLQLAVEYSSADTSVTSQYFYSIVNSHTVHSNMKHQGRSNPSSIKTPPLFNMKAYSIRPVHLFRWFLIFAAVCALILWYMHRLNLAKQISSMQKKVVTKPSMETKGTYFYLDGKKLRILSGSLHYFRVVPEYWEDRLLKMKAAGLNTVTT